MRSRYSARICDGVLRALRGDLVTVLPLRLLRASDLCCKYASSHRRSSRSERRRALVGHRSQGYKPGIAKDIECSAVRHDTRVVLLQSKLKYFVMEVYFMLKSTQPG